jgi:penicillin-binding protein 1C
MGLGGLGIKLTDLTRLYVGLARLGTTVPLVERCDRLVDPVPAPSRLMDPVAAWYVGNVLIDTPPPENAASGRIAFKTGTSYGYRDAWSIGFDGKRTVGVWVGRADGAPVPGLVGRTAAAPVLFEAFARMNRQVAPLPAAPQGVLLAATGRLPPPLQRFRPGGIGRDSADVPLRIMFPPNGARLELSTDGLRPDPIALKVAAEWRH